MVAYLRELNLGLGLSVHGDLKWHGTLNGMGTINGMTPIQTSPDNFNAK